MEQPIDIGFYIVLLSVYFGIPMSLFLLLVKYRVKDAKVKLRDAQYENYTIIAIAYDTGLNSKIAFYTAFKKFAGTTPSQYRKSAVLV